MLDPRRPDKMDRLNCVIANLEVSVAWTLLDTLVDMDAITQGEAWSALSDRIVADFEE